MATAIEEYGKARKLGYKEQQKAIGEGTNPYLPVLDEIIESMTLHKEEKIGTREIMLSQVVGTVTRGRQEAFARNFMPLLQPDTEFAAKWAAVYDYQVKEGIQDAIKVLEYLGKFYVLEGNKRVSVMSYFEMPSILATVTRVLPLPSEDKEIVVYNEFLKFFKATSLYDIQFSEEGDYDKLAEAVGKDMETVWDEDTIMDLRSAFRKFSQAYKSKGKDKQLSDSDAFLVYIEMYRYESLIDATVDEIKKNLSAIWPEIEIAENGNQIAFSKEPQLQKKSVMSFMDPIIDSIFQRAPYDTDHPLNVLFIHNGDANVSRWVNDHEKGRVELEEKFPGVVKTLSCDLKDSDEETFEETVSAAAEDGVELIITTSPVQMEYALRAAVKHPNIKFLNCSIHLSHEAVRTYYGRMYEAKLILGVIAATMSEDGRIGYVSTYPICGNIANINAFAIGVAMVNPRAKIYLTWNCIKDSNWRDYIKANNLEIVSGPDLVSPVKDDSMYGLFKVEEDDSITNIAFPDWKWGKYYELIVQTILNGAWNAESETEDAKNKAINYWWGMSSGVIDVNLVYENIPYSTRKILGAIRKTLVSDVCNPFDGELWSQNGMIKGPRTPRLSDEEIINMSWLCDNVIGTIPSFEQLTEHAQETVKANGMPIISNLSGDKNESTSNC